MQVIDFLKINSMMSPKSKSQLAQLKKEFASFKLQVEIQRSLLDKLNIGIINIKNLLLPCL